MNIVSFEALVDQLRVRQWGNQFWVITIDRTQTVMAEQVRTM